MKASWVTFLPPVPSLIGVQCGLSGATAPAAEPLLLDLSPCYWQRRVTPTRTNTSFHTIAGRRVIDGLPFQVDGRACLYGKAQASYASQSRTHSPDILGIKVGRAFDELHLLHATQWPDVEVQTIARIRLNYADGNTHEFPIGYGVHVRDWQRLQSEAREIVTDPDSKVIWRGLGNPNFKSSARIFKSTLVNPFPAKLVATLDFISTGHIASYDVAAATVANRDPNRTVTPSVPLDRLERDFNAQRTVRVLDNLDRPVKDVWVYPNISVPGSAWAAVTAPLYTSAQGTGLVKYPAEDSRCIVFNVEKDGWRSVSETVSFGSNGAPDGGVLVTICIQPDPAVMVAGPAATGSNSLTAGSVAAGAPATVGGAASGIPANSSTRSAASATGEFRPRMRLIISEPAGSTVRVEYTDSLNPPRLDTADDAYESSRFAVSIGLRHGGAHAARALLSARASFDGVMC